MKSSAHRFTDLLEEIVDNRGRTCPTADSGIPLIATNCVRNDLLYPAFEKIRFVDTDTYGNWFRGHPAPGDLIFVTKGTPGRVCMAPDPVGFCIAQDMVALRADKRAVYPRYLFALLRSEAVQRQIENMHVGTLIPHFKKGDFDKLFLELPDRKTQEFVGDLYFSLSDKIELNRRMNETLEAMARALFKSWFVDFDPVRAKMAGRDPGLPKDIADLFPDRLVESELGGIPEGWRPSDLGSEAKRFGGCIQTGPFGSQLHAADYVAEGIPVVMPKDLAQRRIRATSISRVCEADATRLSRHRLQAGDIVYSRRGDVEQHGLVGREEEGWLCGTGCLLVRLGQGWPSPRLTSLALDHPETRAWIVRHAIGATMPNLNTQILSRVPFLVPSLGLVQKFDELVKPLDDAVVNNNAMSAALAVLRDSLLPKLISGEVRPRI